MKRTRYAVRSLAALALYIVPTAPVVAGIADSPLPVLSAGVTTFHLYSVPFVTRGGGLETVFACTSTDTVPIQVGVEVFGAPGGAPFNDAAATSLTLNPGANVRFGTSSTASISINSSVGGSPSGGSARILATSKKLVCTAFLVDGGNAPPTSMVYLTIIAKTKQKAAN